MNTLDDHTVDVAEKINLLNNEYNSRLVSEELQILRPYLKNMNTIAALRTVGRKAQPFALSLILGSLGIYTSTSPIGIVGPHLEKILKAITCAADALHKGQTPGNQMLLENSIAVVTTGIMIFSAMGAAKGTASPLFDEDAQNEINSFSLELIALIGIYSQAPYTIFKTLAEVCHYPNDTARAMSDILTTAAIMLALKTISRGKGPHFETLLSGAETILNTYLNRIETTIESLTNSEAISSDMSRDLTVVIKQTKAALNTDSAKGLVEAVNSALHIIEITPENLDEDIERLYVETKALLDLAAEGNEDDLNALTGIWQAG